MYNTLNTYNKTYNNFKNLVGPAGGGCLQDADDWTGPKTAEATCPVLAPCYNCTTTKTTECTNPPCCKSSKQVCTNKKDCTVGSEWATGTGTDGGCYILLNGNPSDDCTNNFGCSSTSCPTASCKGINSYLSCIQSCHLDTCYNTCQTTTPCKSCTGWECNCLNQTCEDSGFFGCVDPKDYSYNTGNFPNCTTSPTNPYCWKSLSLVKNNGDGWYLQIQPSVPGKNNGYLGTTVNTPKAYMSRHGGQIISANLCHDDGVSNVNSQVSCYDTPTCQANKDNNLEWLFTPWDGNLIGSDPTTFKQGDVIGLANKKCYDSSSNIYRYLSVYNVGTPSGSNVYIDEWGSDNTSGENTPQSWIINDIDFTFGDIYNGQLYDGCTFTLTNQLYSTSGRVISGGGSNYNLNCSSQGCDETAQVNETIATRFKVMSNI